MSTTTTPKDATKTTTFTMRQLPTFNPYKVIGIETHTKPVSGKTQEGKEYSFDSKNHTLKIIPQKNTDIVVDVNVYDQDYQQMLAIATLYGGFDRCILTTNIDPSSTAKKPKYIHTGVKTAS